MSGKTTCAEKKLLSLPRFSWLEEILQALGKT